MLKTIMLQLSLLLVMVGCALLVEGNLAGLSVMLGGATYLLPSSLFALRLSRLARMGPTPGASYPLEFFIGEAIKVFSTIGLLVLSHYLVPDLMWGWFLGGLAAVLQAGFFAFLFKH